MVYVDASVALAEILAEDRRPPEDLWTNTLISSRLLQYEIWTRLHSLGVAQDCQIAANDLLARVSLVEMTPTILARVLNPFPKSIRTLDAIHIATALHLHNAYAELRVATYDGRFGEVAELVGLSVQLLP